MFCLCLFVLCLEYLLVSALFVLCLEYLLVSALFRVFVSALFRVFVNVLLVLCLEYLLVSGCLDVLCPPPIRTTHTPRDPAPEFSLYHSSKYIALSCGEPILCGRGPAHPMCDPPPKVSLYP